MTHSYSRAFEGVDVTEDITGMTIRDMVKRYCRHLPKYNCSYRSANKSWIHIRFNGDDCTISFYYRSWRYVNVTFSLSNHVIKD